MKKPRRNVLPLLLAAVLLISAGAYGTRAYFTSNAGQNLEIQLQVGHLLIENKTNSEWEYAPQGSGDYVVNKQLKKVVGDVKTAYDNLAVGDKLGKDIKLVNVRPGDAFTRVFTFENTGNLDQRVTINKNALVETLPYTVTIESTTTGETITGGFIVAPKDTVTCTVKLAVLNGVGDGDNSYNNPNGAVLDYLKTALSVEARQPNDPNTSN